MLPEMIPCPYMYILIMKVYAASSIIPFLVGVPIMQIVVAIQ